MNNRKEFIEKIKSLTPTKDQIGMNNPAYAFGWVDAVNAIAKLVADEDLACVRLSSEKIDELWESFCQDVPENHERVLAMRGTRRMNKTRFLDALGSITDEA